MNTTDHRIATEPVSQNWATSAALKDAMRQSKVYGIVASKVDELKFSSFWLNEFREKRVFNNLTVYLFSYCDEKQHSYYFELKNDGFNLIEHCSGLGELRVL